ncbi:MAG TPA: hypothetical protein VM737_09635 [Gemmatimonadota bacterium]|nr:hypothetical protein [Gemmatimonadota bacterium]
MSRANSLHLAAVLLLGVLFPRPAVAQEWLALTTYGVRAGASLDDDLTQLLLGGHVDIGRPYENIRIQPLITLGLGDDALSFLIAGEAHYLFPVDPNRSRVDPYAGGGLGLHHVNFDDDADHDDSTEVALLLTAGADIPMRTWWGYFAEARFLIGDNSIFRVEGGITWVY